MALTFYPNLAEEHEKGAYLGYFVNSRNANGNYELHFDSQSDFLRLIGNGLYLSSDLEYDFETELIYNVSPEGLITYYQVGVQQAVKFVYDDLDFDWAYADLTFVDIDEGHLTYEGWQSPWAPISDVEKSGVDYIDALLLDDQSIWNSDTHFHDLYSNNGSTVITFSFSGLNETVPLYVDNYDDWKNAVIKFKYLNKL